jgi:DNA-binding MarR family transcriptional regulator
MREADQLSGMLIQVAEQAKHDFAEIAGSLNLPVTVARAVVMLSEPAPMRDLADRLACDRSYVTGIADQLEEHGLVERVVGSDRRVKLLQLTPHGIDTRNKISTVVARRALVLRRLSDTQRAQLRPLLEALLVEGRRDDASGD